MSISTSLVLRGGNLCLKFKVITGTSKALISPNPFQNVVSSINNLKHKMETFAMLNLNVFLTYIIAHFHIPMSETKLMHNTFSFIPFFTTFLVKFSSLLS